MNQFDFHRREDILLFLTPSDTHKITHPMGTKGLFPADRFAVERN
jgi:hypothetical protein